MNESSHKKFKFIMRPQTWEKGFRKSEGLLTINFSHWLLYIRVHIGKHALTGGSETF